MPVFLADHTCAAGGATLLLMAAIRVSMASQEYAYTSPVWCQAQ